MRAVLQERFGPPDLLRLGEIDRPRPGPGEVLVRVHCASVNPYDWHMMRGDPYAARLLGGMGLRRPKHRVAGIDAAGLAIVAGWVEVRTALGLGADVPLFCTLTGGPLHPAYVRQLLPRLAAKAGIAKRVHAQGLRHTHAAELAAEGLPAELIQAQLGHGSLASTDRYLRRIPPADRIGALQRRLPASG